MSSNAYNQDDLVEDESHQVVSSLFLGPKAENFDWFAKCLMEVLEAQKDARLDYFPRDGKVITDHIQASYAFRQSRRKMTNAIRQASRLMAKHSIPFFSPRYQGHMCMDMSMPALLGYFMTMLYNPNNVSIEASPITTVAELQVGEDLCNMFGFNTNPKDEGRPVGWGHITCDGTVANLESMWVARNLKFYPFSIKWAMEERGPLSFIASSFKVPTCREGKMELLSGLGNWNIQNLRPKDVLDIPERLYKEYYISPSFLNDVMKTYGIQAVGKRALDEKFKLGDMKYFLSNTKHYSWPKSAALTGIGSDNVIGLQVDHGARVDLNYLQGKLDECLKNEVAVYAVVAIIGSTEEGAVDPLSKILKMREEYQKKGLSFLVHGDGAWGGYFCTMLPTQYKRGEEIALPSDGGSVEGFVPDAGLKTRTAEDLFMLREADSVTVDPHKAAYIPYPAGALCYRDGRLRYLVTWTSPYISRGETTETSIGVFGVEGSKPGASVMSTWLANACIGLGPEGYGKLLGEVTYTCSRLSAEWASMSTEKDPFKIVPLNELPSELAEYPKDMTEEQKKEAMEEALKDEQRFIRESICQKTNMQIIEEDKGRPPRMKAMHLLRELGSDLNINAFSANWQHEDGSWNEDVEEANYFNQLVIQDLSVDSPEDEPTKIPFYLTSTTFMIHEYGECAQHFKKRLGLIQDDTDLVVMRNVVMSPWPTDGYFINNLINEYKKVMNKHVMTCRKRNNTDPEQHRFILQGTDKLYAIHFPMFNLEKHRCQLIFEVKLPQDALEKYLEVKKFDPTGLYMLKSMDKISLPEIVQSKKGFQVELTKRVGLRGNPQPGEDPYNYNPYKKDISLEIVSVVKHRSLKSQFRDRKYPSGFVPFYLFGTKKCLIIDHVLVRSPNISLSADDVKLSADLLDAIPEESLASGCLLALEDRSEAAMQPFQSTEGTLSDTLDSTSNFFFTPGSKFTVSVYADPKGATDNGPGLVDLRGEHEHSTGTSSATHGHSVNGFTNGETNGEKTVYKHFGRGEMTLSKGLYVDSVQINKDPFHIPEGNEKYKKWKEVFLSIGKELD